MKPISMRDDVKSPVNAANSVPGEARKLSEMKPPTTSATTVVFRIVQALEARLRIPDAISTTVATTITTKLPANMRIPSESEIFRMSPIMGPSTASGTDPTTAINDQRGFRTL